MTIKEAWGVIMSLNIELVEQYSARECDRWHKAIQTLQDFLLPRFVDPKRETAQPNQRQHRKNPKTQFEFITISKDELISEAYEWCKNNLPLKDERGIIYWVNKLYIITSSQAVIDKLNKHFGSNFGFGINDEKRYFLILNT